MTKLLVRLRAFWYELFPRGPIERPRPWPDPPPEHVAAVAQGFGPKFEALAQPVHTVRAPQEVLCGDCGKQTYRWIAGSKLFDLAPRIVFKPQPTLESVDFVTHVCKPRAITYE